MDSRRPHSRAGGRMTQSTGKWARPGSPIVACVGGGAGAWVAHCGLCGWPGWPIVASLARLCQAERMTRAHLDKRPADVAAMFDRTARRYDLMNDVLSLGQDRLWRRAVARALNGAHGELILDLAAGTGTSARTFAASGANCVACDFSLGMLREGASRRHVSLPGRVSFLAGDALSLPLRDGSFDGVTISFGLRNVADPHAALREMLRVTRPGGRLVICEFSHIPVRPADLLYQRYLKYALPSVASLLSSNPDAYGYLAESIKDWPDQAELTRWLQAAGWTAVRWRRLSFGIVALHSALRPAPGQLGGHMPGLVRRTPAQRSTLSD